MLNKSFFSFDLYLHALHVFLGCLFRRAMKREQWSNCQDTHWLPRTTFGKVRSTASESLCWRVKIVAQAKIFYFFYNPWRQRLTKQMTIQCQRKLRYCAWYCFQRQQVDYLNLRLKILYSSIIVVNSVLKKVNFPSAYFFTQNYHNLDVIQLCLPVYWLLSMSCWL